MYGSAQTRQLWSCKQPQKFFTRHRPRLQCVAAVSAHTDSSRRQVMSLGLSTALVWSTTKPAHAAEQGIKASDYTVPALSAQEYKATIANLRGKAWSEMSNLVDANKYIELSNNLVLSPIDDIRQAVLYIPSALLKEGKRQEAIGSRQAYAGYMRELKLLDELLQKANRFEADEEDVLDSLARLSQRLDSVVQYVR